MFSRGWIQLFTWRGVPVRAHWTLPLGALLFTGGTFAPVAWATFFALVLIHEIGHASLARRFKSQVTGIEITGFGGTCRWAGYPTDRERALIAWGGVASQAVVLAIAAGIVLAVGWPKGLAGELFHVLIQTNAWLIMLNLLPFPPLDGAEAWKLFATISLRSSLRDAWRHLTTKRIQHVAKDSRPVTPGRAEEEVVVLMRRIRDEARAARTGRRD